MDPFDLATIGPWTVVNNSVARPALAGASLDPFGGTTAMRQCVTAVSREAGTSINGSERATSSKF